MPLEDALKTAQWKELEFEVAGKMWLELRRGNCSEKTLHEYALNLNTLLKFFRPYRLSEITSESIQEYQQKRQAEGIGFSAINHETSVLQQLLKHGGLWEEIRPFFHPIRKKKWRPGRVLLPAEKDRLLRHGRLNPGWAASLYFAQISVNTSCGPKEVQCLRLRDIFLDKKVIHISEEGAKNHERIRPVPLNAEAFKAVELAIERARSFGANQPEHYIFPFREKRTKQYDPTRHQVEFKWCWKKMTHSAGLDGLKMYDLRRTFITEQLNDPMVPQETLIKICGHIGKEMLSHYSYRRMDAMRKVVARLDKPKPRAEKKSPQPAVENRDKLTEQMSEMLILLGKLVQKTA